MRNLYTLLLLSIFSGFASAQTRYTIWDFRDSLKLTGIDSLMVYSQECAGSAPVFVIDNCFIRDPYYLMWRSNGKFYIKRFDQCHRYRLIEIDSLKPYQFYFKNKTTIDTEEIRPPTFAQYFKKGNKFIRQENIIVAEHDCVYKFFLSVNGQTSEKKVSWFNLTNKNFDGRKNINYDRNQRTRLKELIDAIDDTVSQLQENKMIVIE